MKTNRGVEHSWSLLAMIFVLTLILSLTLVVGPGNAAIPQKINHQGYLTNAAGVPVNGTVQVVFSIYNVSVGGSALWTETQNVTVTQGVYNVELGGVTPIGLAFDIPYYLGVRVGSDSEMTPRIVLTSVGYAFRAKTVESVGSHTHSGADITTGTVSEPRIDALIARDSEVTAAVNAHATRTDNPHSTTAAQVGAVALNQINSITSAMIVDGTIMNADISGTAAIDFSKLSGVASSTHNHDAAYVNEGQVNSITVAMIQPGAVTDAKITGPISGSKIGSTGLNADTLDGIDSAGFASVTHSHDAAYVNATGDTMSGTLNINASFVGINSTVSGSGPVQEIISVWGTASATGPVVNYGGNFTAMGDYGYGVVGTATAMGSVTNYGGVFEASGDSGRGVYGVGMATGAVTNYGGYFEAYGNSGIGVYGSTSGTSGGTGVYGQATATGPIANYGGAFSASGDYGYGIYSTASGPSAIGVYGGTIGTSGIGVEGYANGTSGKGVFGIAAATGTGVINYGGYFTALGDSGSGVYAETSGTWGTAVEGWATGTGFATNYGGIFRAFADNGYGVYGIAPAIYGFGVRGDGGNWDFYAGGPGGNYGPFTGGHEVRLSDNFPQEVKLGMIVSVTGQARIRKGSKGKVSISSTLPTIKLSSVEMDKTVLGAFVAEVPLPKDHWYTPSSSDRFGTVNALGEGRVLVTNLNGNIEAGDYITTSFIPGYGQRQEDDLLHSYTLGKAIETVDWDSATETVQFNGKTYKVYLIAVVYTSG